MVHVMPFDGSDVLAVYSDSDGFGARVLQSDDGAVVAVVGEIDLATTTLLQQAIQDASSRSHPVIIDMADTTFIDSSGLHVLVRAYQDLGPESLRLRAVNAGIRRVFAISGVDQLMTLVPDTV
jgi:anti-sigma B factor antagonist